MTRLVRVLLVIGLCCSMLPSLSNTIDSDGALGLRVRAFAPPNAPTNPGVGAYGTNFISLFWTDTSTNESGFRVELKIGSGGTYSLAAQTSANIQSTQLNSLTPGTTYFFRVKAFNNDGESAPTEEIEVTTLTPSPPTAPTDLGISAYSSTFVVLFWTDRSIDESGFIIEMKVGSGGTYSQVAQTGADVTSQQISNLSSGTTYFFRVKAFNVGGSSSYTNEVQVTTL